MSYVIAGPDAVVAAAGDLAALGSTIEAAGAAAFAPTTQIQAAAADEVSSAISALFGAHAEQFQALAARGAAPAPLAATAAVAGSRARAGSPAQAATAAPAAPAVVTASGGADGTDGNGGPGGPGGGGGTGGAGGSSGGAEGGPGRAAVLVIPAPPAARARAACNRRRPNHGETSLAGNHDARQRASMVHNAVGTSSAVITVLIATGLRRSELPTRPAPLLGHG
jgi:PE family